MPMLRLASAPKSSPATTAIASPSRTPHHGFQPRLRPFVLPFVVDVAEDEAGDPVDRDLGEREHAAVRRQEDQARSDDPEDEHLRQQRADPVAREERRREDGQSRGDRSRSAIRGEPHAGLPNRPSGRTASTSAISTNVKMIE